MERLGDKIPKFYFFWDECAAIKTTQITEIASILKDLLNKLNIKFKDKQIFFKTTLALVLPVVVSMLPIWTVLKIKLFAAGTLDPVK